MMYIAGVQGVSLPFWQLLTVIAIPTLMVFVGILLNERGVTRVERRIDRLEDRTAKLEGLHHEEIRDLLSLLGDYYQRIVRIEGRLR
jgi:membrane protein implicated in regulation of membrane protease activity